MNIGILLDSLIFLSSNFENIVSMNTWMCHELVKKKYCDHKLIRSFEKFDYEVSEAIIHLVQDKKTLDKLLSDSFGDKEDKSINLRLNLLMNNNAQRNNEIALRCASYVAKFGNFMSVFILYQKEIKALPAIRTHLEN